MMLDTIRNSVFATGIRPRPVENPGDAEPGGVVDHCLYHA